MAIVSRTLFSLASVVLLGVSTAAASHTKVYVANQGSNTVTVIDDQRVSAMAAARAGSPSDEARVLDSDFAIVATIPVGANPQAVATSADGTLAYVANLGSNTLTIIDTELDVVVATVSAGPNPRDVEATPDGRYVLVTNQLPANLVTVLETSSYSIVAQIPVGTNPCAISIAPDSSVAYITNRGSNNISIIDLRTLTMTGTVTVGTFACDVMFTPDGRLAVVTNRVSGTITVIDTLSTQVVATVATGPSPQGVAFNPDGSRAYITNAGNIAVIDMSSLIVVDSISNIPSGPCPVAATMDMNQGHDGHIYVASNTQPGVVNVVDAGTNSVIAVLPVGVRPLGIGVRMWPRLK